ncbi:hypothetical protein [Runella limosa]|uniref:hypothetical protein n=1 Tax=Runella limosa TaxID=370978 RepID=UPI000414B651|nr:hypothetical protein [Runella limosa]MCA0234155.1 hypothetical protein [Bacteroidota bacterium]
MNRTAIFLVFAVVVFLVWYTPKIRAAQRLNYRPLLPTNFRVSSGAIEWIQPIAVTNALNASLSIQNADFRVGNKEGYQYAQCVLPNKVLIQPNATTAMPLLVQIGLLDAPAVIQKIIADGKGDGTVSLYFSGVVKAEWVWFTVPTFSMDVPINFFK